MKFLYNLEEKVIIYLLLFTIVFSMVRDIVASYKTTRMRVRKQKLNKKITLLKYNVAVQAALYAKER